MKKRFITIHLKTLVFLFIQLSTFYSVAQVPALINYQGIVRDDKGFPVSNQAIALKFEILQGSATGPVVYTDDQATGVSTNTYGLFTTQIGKNSGFGQVNWQQGVSYYLKIWVDPAGGANLVALGNPQQITSVPYAFHAQTVPATYSNNILSIGNKTFDITPSITSVPNTSITLSGLGTITSAGTNSFDINIPAPTFSNSGQQIITGTYPNYTVNTPTVPASSVPTIGITNIAAAGSSVTSSGNSFGINVPPPSFTNAGPATITGSYPNYTINSSTGTTYTNGTGISITSGSVITNTSPNITPSIAATATTGAGPSVSSTGSSFNINVPPPVFSNVGPATITGTYPNYTINSPVATTYTNGTGISITSGSVITNTSPNITPSIAATATSAAGPSVTSLGSSYNINVPPPVFSNVGPATITGTYPNYTINSPVATTYTNGTGISITSGSIITNTSPNITPTVAVSTTVAAAASVSSSGSSFNVNVPPPVFTNASQSIVTGTYPNFTVNTPTVAVSSIAVTSTAAAAPAITNSGSSFNINIPTTNAWSILGNTGTSAASNFIGTTDNVDLNFRTNSTTKMFLQNTGYLSIGTTAALYSNTGLLVARNGAFDNRLVVAGGDNSNSYGGILTLAENVSQSQGMSIKLDASGNRLLITTDPVGSNAIVGIGGYSGATPGVAIGSGYAYGNAPTDGLIVQGNVGIGTANPNAPLQFGNTIANRKIVLWEGTNNDHQYYGFGINGSTLRYQVDATGADHVFFAGTGVAASNELMRIKGNGNVGIGTAIPGRRFVVSPDGTVISDNTGQTTLYHASGIGNALFAEGNNTGNSSGATAYSRAMMAGYNNTSPFGAGNSGLWGVVTGSGSDGYGVIASFGTSYNAPNTYVGLAGRDAGVFYAGIFMGGNVGIGLTNPAFNLQLAANSAAKPTSNVWTVSSDARLKKDVHNYEAGLAEVLKIRPVWFTYTGEAGMPQETGVGIIAQELQQVAPYMVKEWTYMPGAKNTQGSNNQQASPKTAAGVNYLGVDNGPMTYMLINAVKEQQQQIEDSKKQMEELKKQVEEQKKLIDILLKK